MTDPVQQLLAASRQAAAPQIFLVRGDLVVAEPVAARFATALAAEHGGQVESHRRPASLAPLLHDLRTFSLFASAKVILAVDTSLFADRAAAADLIDDAEEALPAAGGRGDAGGDGGAVAGAAGRRRSGGTAAAMAASPGEEGEARPKMGARERLAASRLLQVLRLFEIPIGSAPAADVVDQLPAWVLEGGAASRRARGGRGRGKRQVEDLRTGLTALFERARAEGVEAGVEGDLSDLSAAITGGLPAGHALVFAERQVAAEHPLVRLLQERGAVAAVGEVESTRGAAWQGAEHLVTELAEETGVGITGEALAELARRTLRKAGDPRRGGGDAAQGSATGDSTARLAAEYRKLANLTRAGGQPGARIERGMVQQEVEDRGEEDVWKLLDAIGAGHGGEAMDRFRRLLASADDPMAARLSLFALLATFCRRLTAIRGMMRVARVPAGEANYGRFAARLAPALQGDLAGGKNPLAGVNAYALHRAYLAAGRIPEAVAARLPWEVLETELRIKGDSAEADTAFARLILRLSTAISTQPARPGRR